MKKLIASMVALILGTVVFSVVLLSGCDGTQPTTKAMYDLKQVKGLEDCTFYRVDPGGNYNVLSVIRCPNSAVNTTEVRRSGKSSTTISSVVIDGVEYVKR
jgi:hypothetical protein